MSYKVKEIYYTLQGEGAHSGRPAVFLRFTGCNLWTGREQDRENAVCQFCDTDFIGMDGENGGKYSAQELVVKCLTLWPAGSFVRPYIVCTGGEPALQLDKELIDEFHFMNCIVAIESNGTIELPEGIDWICISPKMGSELIVKEGNELKLVYPQQGQDPEQFLSLNFEHFYLQPMDSIDLDVNIAATIEYCKNHPAWNLSLQSHKILHIP